MPDTSNEREYQAVVEKVVPSGKHGPYVVSRCEAVGTVTFSLGEGDDVPESGTYVMLSRLRKKRAGWRALAWRFIQPSDER